MLSVSNGLDIDILIRIENGLKDRYLWIEKNNELHQFANQLCSSKLLFSCRAVMQTCDDWSAVSDDNLKFKVIWLKKCHDLYGMNWMNWNFGHMLPGTSTAGLSLWKPLAAEPLVGTGQDDFAQIGHHLSYMGLQNCFDVLTMYIKFALTNSPPHNMTKSTVKWASRLEFQRPELFQKVSLLTAVYC